MVGDLEVTPSVVIPAAELRERFSRSSGPGGQGVNTADSRVELSLDVLRSPSVPESLRERIATRLAGRLVDGVLTVVASEHRTQLANRRAARQRLAAVLRQAAAPSPPQRRPSRPGPAAIERRLAVKRRRAQSLAARRVPRDEPGGYR